MKQGISVFIILSIIATVFSFVFPSDTKRVVTASISQYEASELEMTDYDSVRSVYRVPAELPYLYTFDDSEFDKGFEYDLTVDLTPGYYCGPQTLRFDCSDTLWYTLDGSLPDKNSPTTYLYDDDSGIDIDGITNICLRVEKNGRMSTVYIASYVILNPIEEDFYGYAYHSLDRNDRLIYRRLYNCIENYETTFDLPFTDISYQHIYRILMCINYDNPLLFQTPLSFNKWSGDKNDIRSISLSYDFTKDETEYYAKKVKQKSQEILKEADGAETLSEYLLSIHNSILKEASYDYSFSDPGVYEAFGVLVDGTGVCESYSRAFQYLCQCIGVDNILVVGLSGDEPHMWNMIMLDDDWYHSDLTWDDEDNGSIIYDFFCFNDMNLKTYGERNISPELDESGAIMDMYQDSNYYPIPSSRSNVYTVSNYYYY